MQILRPNLIGRNTRVRPDIIHDGFSGVELQQGTQVLSAPVGSKIRNLILAGGASDKSRWAALRGAVIKMDLNREKPIEIDGQGRTIPTGHTLMDEQNLKFIREKRNGGNPVPFEAIDDMSSERLYLVHASFCHPQDIFLPQGTYTLSSFYSNTAHFGHMVVKDGNLELSESSLPKSRAPFNILEALGFMPESITVGLIEGGHVSLQR